MGLAIIIPNADFSSVNLGKVTLTEDVDLQALSISGASSVTGTEAEYSVSYIPSNTNQRGVVWSIESGSAYASINSSTGKISINRDANNSMIIIKATSAVNNNISATKTVFVTFGGEQATAIYSLEGRTFNGQENVATSVPLTKSVHDYTLLFDITLNDSLANQKAIYSEMDTASPWSGLLIRINNNSSVTAGKAGWAVASIIAGKTIGVVQYTTNNVRRKFAVVIKSSDLSMTTYNDANTEVFTTNFTETEYLTTKNPTPMLGSDQNTANRFFKGTMHKVEFFDKVMSEEFIRNWFES